MKECGGYEIENDVADFIVPQRSSRSKNSVKILAKPGKALKPIEKPVKTVQTESDSLPKERRLFSRQGHRN